jgi:hypothetical protein
LLVPLRAFFLFVCYESQIPHDGGSKALQRRKRRSPTIRCPGYRVCFCIAVVIFIARSFVVVAIIIIIVAIIIIIVIVVVV